ncbi:MAG: sulfatase-like hydrolase/transferase [Planctomycetota bacterium]|nr:sulfatase-like hydrolase/transferase [Planctomycetota bacterium]
MFSVDHWPASLLGVAGHPVIQTPTLDSLARIGTRYTNAYTECPVCIPARRTLLTGTSPRTHGDRTFEVDKPLPGIPTIADVFSQHGYQAYASGKLHVYPPRARAGFDDVQLCEEGRPQMGPTDDYEIYLGEQGLVGQQFMHGMSNNDYHARPWHLDEKHHSTNWITREMCRFIQRRDPTRPAFWYCSYTHPHPPLVPPRWYLDLYKDTEIPVPRQGTWPTSADTMPCWMNNRLIPTDHLNDTTIRFARQAFYALCTHIDHQMRIVLGTLREEGILDNTILMFLSDHGDMLGEHGLFAKRLFYEDSAGIPMLLVDVAGRGPTDGGRTDHRLVGLQDCMPTLLEMCELPVPDSVDGLSMANSTTREYLYGEYGEGFETTRMLHNGRFKLIYFAAGNRSQLFDLDEDPHEMTDLSDSLPHKPVLEKLTALLISELYDADEPLLVDGVLQGLPMPPHTPPDRNLSLQRGSHWPVPPQS